MKSCQYRLYSLFHSSQDCIHSHSSRWHDDTDHCWGTFHMILYNLYRTSYHHILWVDIHVFDKFQRFLQIKIVAKFGINISKILLWSHWAFFHPAWHPPIQCPVTLSHFPEITQCLLQCCRQFSPNRPARHSRFIKV